MRYIKPRFSLLVLVGLTSIAPNSFSQALQDPTLPPAFLRNDQPSSSVGQEENSSSTIADLSLQALILGNQKSYAVINGSTFQVGSTYKGWRIIRINSEGALLQGTSGTQLLKIHPGISKTGRP